MKNVLIVLAVLAGTLAFASSQAQAGNGHVVNGVNHQHHNFNRFNSFGYGFNSFAYSPYVVSPVAASYYPVVSADYGAGTCGAGYNAAAFAPAYQVLSPAVYQTNYGYNPFLFSRFFRGRSQVFGHGHGH